MNLLLLVLRLLWGGVPHRIFQMQLAPVPSRRGAPVATCERTDRCLWIPGVGWLAWSPLSWRLETTERRLWVYRLANVREATAWPLGRRRQR